MAATSQKIQVLIDGLPTDLEIDSDLWGQGTLAQRPASGDNDGDLYLVVDTNFGRLDRWNGSAWIRLTVIGPQGGSVLNRAVRWGGTDGDTLLNSLVGLTDDGSVQLNPLAADPSSPVDGEVWYNTTEDRFRGQFNGTTFPLTGPDFTGTVRTVHGTDPRADHVTIQAAIDAASNGDIILIGPGDYPEQITIDKNLALIGMGRNFGNNNDPRTNIRPAISATGAAVDRTGGAVTIVLRNLNVTPNWSGATGTCHGIDGSTGGRWIIDNCFVRVSTDTGAGASTTVISAEFRDSSRLHWSFFSVDDFTDFITSGTETALLLSGGTGTIDVLGCEVNGGISAPDNLVIGNVNRVVSLSATRVDGLLDNSIGGTVFIDSGCQFGSVSGPVIDRRFVQRGQLVPVRIATTAALAANTAAGSGVGKTLTADANGALTVDGIATADGDRLLVKDEATGADRGVYDVTDAGSGATPYILTRSIDFDETHEVLSGVLVSVSEGTAHADTIWMLTTNGSITVDTTGLVFADKTGSPTGSTTTKEACRLASPGIIADPLTAAPDIVDGSTVVIGDRILHRRGTPASEEGIYVVDVVGTGSDGQWSRATDWDGAGDVQPMTLIPIREGDAFAGHLFHTGHTATTFTVGTDDPSFAQVLTGIGRSLTAGWTEDDVAGAFLRWTGDSAGWEVHNNNLSASADPTVDDDGDEVGGSVNYNRGSLWIRLTNLGAWICVNANSGNADWRHFAMLDNLTATVNPTVDDDVTLLYEVGSRWFNVTTDAEFVCLDATTGAAVWKETTAAASAVGTGIKDPVRLATDAALPANTAGGSGVGKTLTADANGALTVDGVGVATNDRVLVKDEATGSDRGIYDVTTPGSGGTPYVLTRATDFDEDAEVDGGVLVSVQEGTANAETTWMLSTDEPITVDTTSLTFIDRTGSGAAPSGWPFDGDVLTVHPTDPDADHATIQAALNAMDAGDVVLVSPADYAEELTLQVNGTMYSFGGVRIRPTISVDGNSAVTTLSAVTEFTFVNIDIKPIVTNATAAGTTNAVTQGQNGLLRFINSDVIPETASGVASDLVLRAARFTNGSLEVFGNSIFSIEDSGNLISAGTKETVFYTPANTIRFDGGARILSTANAAGLLRVSNASLTLELGECRVEGSLTISAAGTATRTGATHIESLTDSGNVLVNIGPKSRNDGASKRSVRLATDAALSANTAAGSGIGKTLTADANGSLTVDGVGVAAGDRLLVKDEVTGADRGIYVVTAAGSGGSPYILTRSLDFDNGDNGDGIIEIESGVLVAVQEGTANSGKLWMLTTTGTITIDTTSLTFTDKTGGVPATIRREKSITIEDPTASEDINLLFTNRAVTITEMRAVVRGSSPSVTWTIRHGTDRSATGAEVVTGGTATTSQSTGSDVTSFNDETVVADSFVWVETTAQTGTVEEIAITIFYDED